MKRNGEDRQSEMAFSTQEMAELLELSPRRIQQLAKEGILISHSRGKYVAVESIRNFIRYSVEKEGPSDEDVDYWNEKALHERAKRQKTELALAVMKGEMHRSEDVKMVMNDMLAAFRSRILAMPSKLAPQLLNMSEMPVVLETLTKEAYEALTELSEYDPQKFYAVSEEYVELSEDDNSS
ncbi:hypothetical protein [Brevibacillus nitrificans]|uniref:hypothetical protein n=1 Tax=Brevibacillus nitrificans TaxID=651560 RepID=UPI00285B9A0E|nr:hypothetical protein [Brevibacillus nitrificans]MDR7318903.1 phage terminase Nu1 subunit (DNA packaging protein) [Brevibacillus nitrificans]